MRELIVERRYAFKYAAGSFISDRFRSRWAPHTHIYRISNIKCKWFYFFNDNEKGNFNAKEIER
jgi:hypothetical protein